MVTERPGENRAKKNASASSGCASLSIPLLSQTRPEYSFGESTHPAAFAGRRYTILMSIIPVVKRMIGIPPRVLLSPGTDDFVAHCSRIDGENDPTSAIYSTRKPVFQKNMAPRFHGTPLRTLHSTTDAGCRELSLSSPSKRRLDRCRPGPCIRCHAPAPASYILHPTSYDLRPTSAAERDEGGLPTTASSSRAAPSSRVPRKRAGSTRRACCRA
jgi:hypothetical protein